MLTTLLSEAEYTATFGEPMRDVTALPEAALDIWSYIAKVPAEELEGHEICDHLVEYVYRTPDNRLDHVLVMTKTKNVYLVVVVDRTRCAVVGHRLLNLNKEYGL